MTTSQRPDWDPKLAAALDRFSVPEPRDGWMDGISSAALTRRAPALGGLWKPHTRRAGWARRGFIAGTLTLSLMSATAAAAAGWFGSTAMQLPVISTIAKVIPDSVKPVENRLVHKRAPVKAKKDSATTDADFVLAPTPDISSETFRNNARAERIANRDARRAARGLPPLAQADRGLLTAFRSAKIDAERTAVIERARALRMKRQLANSTNATRPALAGQTSRPLCTVDQQNDPIGNNCRRFGRLGQRLQSAETFGGRPNRLTSICAALPKDRPIPWRCRNALDARASGDQAPTDAPTPPVEPNAEPTAEGHLEP